MEINTTSTNTTTTVLEIVPGRITMEHIDNKLSEVSVFYNGSINRFYAPDTFAEYIKDTREYLSFLEEGLKVLLQKPPDTQAPESTKPCEKCNFTQACDQNDSSHCEPLNKWLGDSKTPPEDKLPNSDTSETAAQDGPKDKLEN